MVKLDIILSIIIGLGIFLTDFIFGWLTSVSGPVPVIFIIAIIIGIVAGTHGGALVSTMITWIGGIVIGIMIAPIVFVDILNPDLSFLGLFIFVFLYSVRGFYTLTYEGNIVEVLVVGLLTLVVMLIITPVLYLFSFAFAPIGVVIGKFIRSRFTGRSVEQIPTMQETPAVQKLSEDFESSEVEEFPEDDKESYDNSEN